MSHFKDWFAHGLADMGLNLRFSPACSATETSLNIKIFASGQVKTYLATRIYECLKL